MKLFDDEVVYEEKISIGSEHYKYLKPLYEIVKDSREACSLLPLYPLETINEYLKYLVYYKDVSGIKVRIFTEKYFDLGLDCPIYRLLELLGDEKYFEMIEDFKTLAEHDRKLP